MGIDFSMIVINDGSRDATSERLHSFFADPCIEVINKPNSGHGPTILMGYRQAVGMADWVFQCDSDNEMHAEYFPSLWRMRDKYDAIFGYREGRTQVTGRKLISTISRVTVRLLYGDGIRDVNTPYRLMRSTILGPIVERIPEDTFAPNVVISGVIARSHLRIINIPIPHESRRTGRVSIVKWRLWHAAVRSFVQTLQIRSSMSEVVRELRRMN